MTPEEIKAYNQTYYQANKERLIKQSNDARRRRKEKDPDFRKEYTHNYYLEHKEQIKEKNKQYEPAKREREKAVRRGEYGTEAQLRMREYHTQFRSEKGTHARLVEALGNKCAQCGITDREVLQVDHVHGQGTRERKLFKNAYQHEKYVLEHIDSGDYQLLCANCNWKKRHANKEHRYRYDQES